MVSPLQQKVRKQPYVCSLPPCSTVYLPPDNNTLTLLSNLCVGAVYRYDVSFPQQEGTAMGRMVGKTGAEAAEGEAVTAGEAGEASAGEALAATAGEATGELATGEAVGGLLDSTGILAPIGILVGIGAALGSLFGGLFGHHHHHHKPPPPPNLSIPSLQTGV